MTKLTRSLALAGMMAAATGALSVAPAQEKGTKKTTTKKGGTVKYHQSPKNEKYYFSVYDANDKFVGGGRSSGYESKDDAVKGIEALRNALDGAKTEFVHKGEDKHDEPEKKEPKKKGGE